MDRSGAVRIVQFSPERAYRYLLSVIWDPSKPLVTFFMLNPSTADETHNDPTVARCQAAAQRWGYGGVLIANACAYRATNPRDLLRCADPVGPDNLAHVMDMVKRSAIVVLASGRGPTDEIRRHIQDMVRQIAATGAELRCIATNSDGWPAHPLYKRFPDHPTVWRLPPE